MKQNQASRTAEHMALFRMALRFQLLEDIGSIDYRAWYMGQNGRHLHGYEFYRIARACVVRSSVSGIESLERRE